MPAKRSLCAFFAVALLLVGALSPQTACSDEIFVAIGSEGTEAVTADGNFYTTSPPFSPERDATWQFRANLFSGTSASSAPVGIYFGSAILENGDVYVFNETNETFTFIENIFTRCTSCPPSFDAASARVASVNTCSGNTCTTFIITTRGDVFVGGGSGFGTLEYFSTITGPVAVERTQFGRVKQIYR